MFLLVWYKVKISPLAYQQAQPYSKPSTKSRPSGTDWVAKNKSWPICEVSILPAPNLGPSHNNQHHRYWWPCNLHFFSLYAVRVSCSTQYKFSTRSKVSVSLMSIPAKMTLEVAVTHPHRFAAGWLCLLLLFSFVHYPSRLSPNLLAQYKSENLNVISTCQIII